MLVLPEKYCVPPVQAPGRTELVIDTDVSGTLECLKGSSWPDPDVPAPQAGHPQATGEVVLGTHRAQCRAGGQARAAGGGGVLPTSLPAASYLLACCFLPPCLLLPSSLPAASDLLASCFLPPCLLRPKLLLNLCNLVMLLPCQSKQVRNLCVYSRPGDRSDRLYAANQ